MKQKIDHSKVSELCHLPETQTYLMTSDFYIGRTGSTVHIDIPDAHLWPWETQRIVDACSQANKDSQRYLVAERQWLQIELIRRKRNAQTKKEAD